MSARPVPAELHVLPTDCTFSSNLTIGSARVTEVA